MPKTINAAEERYYLDMRPIEESPEAIKILIVDADNNPVDGGDIAIITESGEMQLCPNVDVEAAEKAGIKVISPIKTIKLIPSE